MPIDRKLLVSDSGKVILGAGGKLADKDCCCCSCDPPIGDCLHYAQFKVTIDASEVAAGGLSGDFADFMPPFGGVFGFGVYIDYDTSEWVGYSISDGAEARLAVDHDSLANSVHCVQLRVDKCGDVRGQICVDGVTSDYWTEASPASSYTEFRAGSYLAGGISHHTISAIKVKPWDAASRTGARAESLCALDDWDGSGNNENEFEFPESSFDSIVGGASVVSGQLRIDAEAGDAYGVKALSSWDLACSIPPYSGGNIEIAGSSGGAIADGPILTIDGSFGTWTVAVDTSYNTPPSDYGRVILYGDLIGTIGESDLWIPISFVVTNFGFSVYVEAEWDPSANGGLGAPDGMLISLNALEASAEITDHTNDFYDFGVFTAQGTWEDIDPDPDNYEWQWDCAATCVGRLSVKINGDTIPAGYDSFPSDFPPITDPDSNPSTEPPSDASVDVRIENPP